MNYRSELFDTYDVHAASLDAEDAVKVRWFTGYLQANYLPHVRDLSPTVSNVLEIGSSKGYLLAALRAEGFERLHGVDLSPNDVAAARALVPEADLTCSDATDFLALHPGTFDLIIAKAVLEHVPKHEVMPFLQAIRTGLTPIGVALVDVPNMDWIFAGHERYMDFTHEVDSRASHYDRSPERSSRTFLSSPSTDLPHTTKVRARRRRACPPSGFEGGDDASRRRP